jgi:endonuclease YncB( thermonuclease family)
LLEKNSAAALEVVGPATIIDADTLQVAQTRVRLHGIDAPESGQRCVNEARKIIRPARDVIARLEALTPCRVCAGKGTLREETDDADLPPASTAAKIRSVAEMHEVIKKDWS